MDIDEKALNEKLAKWAGFIKERLDLEGGYWVHPNGGRQIGLNFTQSLDACFKYLEPKFPYLELHNCQAGFSVEVSLDMKDRYQSFGKTPSMAFCLAVEKLIDSEEKK